MPYIEPDLRGIYITNFSFHPCPKCDPDDMWKHALYDGDTIRDGHVTFLTYVPGMQTAMTVEDGFRFEGVDTPEKRGGAKGEKYAADSARDVVEEVLKGASKYRWESRSAAREKYGRFLGRIQCYYPDGASFIHPYTGEGHAFGGDWVDPCEVLIDMKLARRYPDEENGLTKVAFSSWWNPEWTE